MSLQVPWSYRHWMVAGAVATLVASCAFEQAPSSLLGAAQDRGRSVQGGMMAPETPPEEMPMAPTPEASGMAPSMPPEVMPSQAPAATTVTISEQNLRFNPATVTVAVGTTVTWVNNDPQGLPHTTTSDSGLWDSGNMSVGQSFSHTFTQPGTFTYRCTLHQAQGMTGTIVVQ